MKDDILIIGAGHQGLAMAAHLALNGENVNIWNRSQQHIELIQKEREIRCTGVVCGNACIKKASTDICEVLSRRIMVTTPSSAHRDIAKMLAPVLLPDTTIILNPGRTFGAIEFYRILEEMGCKNLPFVAEAQTIVYTCRKFKQNLVNIYALKKDVLIAALKKEEESRIKSGIPDVLLPYFKWCDSVLKTSLGNIGMILHCAPVLLNTGWIESSKWEFKYYYDGISPSIARLLNKMDVERIQVGDKLGIKLESLVEWLKRTYQIEGEDLYSCLQNNVYYHDIDAPLSLHHRYLDEDIPCGLVPLEHIGRELGVDMSVVTLIIDLGNVLCGKDYRACGRRISKEEIGSFLK